MIKRRIEFLKQFDDYVKNNIGDEYIIEYWLEEGLPDEWNETDVEEIAENDELWLDCVEAFKNCCKMAGVI